MPANSLNTTDKLRIVTRVHEMLSEFTHSDAKDILAAVLATMGQDYLDRAKQATKDTNARDLKEARERYGIGGS